MVADPATVRSMIFVQQSPYTAAKDFAVFHDELHALENPDVAEGIVVHGDYIGESTGRDHTDLAFPVEHHGGAGGCALNRVHRRHAEFDHTGKFLGDGLAPGNPTHVGSEDNLDSRLERFLKRGFVY